MGTTKNADRLIKLTKSILPILTLVVLIGTSCEQTPPPSLFSQWNEQDVLELEITADLEAVLANAEQEQTALITWLDANGTTQELDAAIEVRGKTRQEICSFPPLKLKFDEKTLQAKGFNPAYENLKLVTHCLAGNDELVLREYLTYLMLNQLTDKSFRVQLAKVTYRSINSKIEAYAFIIENNDEMANRLGGEIVEAEQLKTIDAAQYRLLTVFQYMIGNTDWNLNKSHNIKLISINNNSFITPVPYDFDHAGLVDAPYAKPHPMMPVKNVRERYLQWRGANTEGLDETLELFKERREILYQQVMDFELLSEASRQDILQYLDSFYNSLPQIPKLAAKTSKKNMATGV